MRITTIDQAQLAFSAVLRGNEQTIELLNALSHPDAASPMEGAAYAMLTAEARAVVGTKRWDVRDVLRTAQKSGVLDGSSRRLVELALVQPVRLTSALPAAVAAGASRQQLVTMVLRAMRFLHHLPSVGGLGPPPLRGPADERQARMLDKVRALLAKAESTQFEAEAEAFTAKAQELMARHAIDEALLEAGGSETTGVTSMLVRIENPYASPKASLLATIARHNRCRAVWSSDFGFSTVFGVPGDLRAVDTLYTSLLVQAVAAMNRADERSRAFRHAFLLAFADRIGERLRQATRSATASAVTDHGDSFLPVLAAREDAVREACEAEFPQTKPMRVSASSATGYAAGRAAADAASISRGAPLVR